MEGRPRSGNLKRDVHAGWSRFTFSRSRRWAAPLTFPARGQLAWAGLELGQRLEVGGGWGGGQGGSYGGGACRRCGRSHVRDAGESLLCPARRSGAPGWREGKIAPPAGEGGHSWKARGNSFLSAASRPRTTSHPRSTGTGDCQSGGGVAAISSKNIWLLFRSNKFLHPGELKVITNKF